MQNAWKCPNNIQKIALKCNFSKDIISNTQEVWNPLYQLWAREVTIYIDEKYTIQYLDSRSLMLHKNNLFSYQWIGLKKLTNLTNFSPKYLFLVSAKNMFGQYLCTINDKFGYILLCPAKNTILWIFFQGRLNLMYKYIVQSLK